MQYKAPPNTNTSTQSNSTLLQSVFSKSYLALSIAFVCHYKMFGNVTCLLRILGKWLVLTFAREQPVSMKWCHLHPIRSQFDILFPNIPLLLCNYPHLRAFEVHYYENMQNSLKIMITGRHYHLVNISATKVPIFMKF